MVEISGIAHERKQHQSLSWVPERGRRLGRPKETRRGAIFKQLKKSGIDGRAQAGSRSGKRLRGLKQWHVSLAGETVNLWYGSHDDPEEKHYHKQIVNNTFAHGCLWFTFIKLTCNIWVWKEELSLKLQQRFSQRQEENSKRTYRRRSVV